MKTIKQDELFESLGGFLKGKGIELKDGSYSHRIRQGCNLLSEAINATQKTVKHAKVRVDQKLDHLRQTIHEATGPKPPPTATASKTPAAGATKKPKAKARGKRSATSGKAGRKS